MNDIGLREAFDDLWIWDTVENKNWIRVDGKGTAPKRRNHHAAGVFGGFMIIMGGVNTEARTVLDDFNIFDFNENRWIDV